VKPNRFASDRLRHVLPDVLGEHVVDERLIPNAPSTCGLSKLLQYASVEPNRNQLARRIPNRWTTHPAHGPELIRGRLRDVAEVNRLRRTPPVPGGSPAAR
jgi:hypothetical protein